MSPSHCMLLVLGTSFLSLVLFSSSVSADFDDSHERFPRRSRWDWSDERDDSDERGFVRSFNTHRTNSWKPRRTNSWNSWNRDDSVESHESFGNSWSQRRLNPVRNTWARSTAQKSTWPRRTNSWNNNQWSNNNAGRNSWNRQNNNNQLWNRQNNNNNLWNAHAVNRNNIFWATGKQNHNRHQPTWRRW